MVEAMSKILMRVMYGCIIPEDHLKLGIYNLKHACITLKINYKIVSQYMLFMKFMCYRTCISKSHLENKSVQYFLIDTSTSYLV